MEYYSQYPIAEYIEKLVDEYPKLKDYTQYCDFTNYMYNFGYNSLDFNFLDESNHLKSLDEIIDFLSQYKGQGYRIVIGEQDVECEHENSHGNYFYGNHQIPTIQINKEVNEFFTYEQFRSKIDAALKNFLREIQYYENVVGIENTSIKGYDSRIEVVKKEILEKGFTPENEEYLLSLNGHKEESLKNIKQHTERFKQLR
jgi:hypothetical protein